MTFEEVLTHFRVSSSRSDSVQCFCPVHAGGREKKPSLTISRGRDGRTMIFCHVCGRGGTEAILNAAGLTWADINPDRKRHGKTVREFAEWPGKNGEFKGAKFVKAYDYRNESGYAFTKCRVALPEGKTFRYCRLDTDGFISEFKVKDRQKYCALYPYRQLQAAKEDKGLILIVEGEKDADNAVKDGFHAVTVGGANDWNESIVKHFTGLQVVVVPDRDQPGYQSAERIAADLEDHGISDRVIRWPDSFTVEKGDYSDFIETFSDRAAGVEAFRNLIGSAVTLSEFRKDREQLHEQDHEVIQQISEDEVSMIAKKIQQHKGGKTFEVTDSACGEMIGRFFPYCRFNTTAKQWYFFDGKRWKLDEEGMEIERAATIFEKALLFYSLFFMNTDIEADDLLNFRKACGSLSKRARRIAAIQDARKENSFSSNELDTDTALFNCLNGVLNLDTGELLPHDPEFMISKISGAEYRPEIMRDDFEIFVSQVLQGDHEKARFLQTFVGYMISGRPVEECFLILYGATTRNGKGTFCETVLRMFGDYGASIRPESLAVKSNRDGSSANDDIARLAGVRFLNCSEPAKGMHLDEALVKSLTGGDKITARHLFERFFEFYPQFTLLMNVNFLPQVTDVTLFSSGRVMVLPFERHFSEEEQDKGLKTRLQESENLSAVLNWVLEGYRRYKSEGLHRPDSVINATTDYADDSDKIKRFFSEELEEIPGNIIPASDVFSHYVEWCKDSGLYAEGKQNFFQLLRGRGLLQRTGTINGITVKNVIYGYKLPEWHETNADWPGTMK